MFNSLNSDEMPLLDSDIISAKLYSNSGEDREDFNTKWSEFKKIILKLEESKITDIDSVLKQYMYIKRSQTKEYISEKGSVNVTTPGLRRYYTETNQQLLQSPLKLTAQLLKVAKIWLAIKDYSIIELCSKFNENINLYLISYLFRFDVDEITESLVTDYVENLLRLFSILELVDIGYSSSKFKTFLFGLNIKLVDKNISLSEIKEEISRHINKEWDKEEIEIEARNYTKNPLVFLNEYLACKESEQKFILPAKYEIEHIMPRSGKNIDRIREDAGIIDKEEFSEIVNKLGNKILLEEDINRSIGNAWFRSKIQNSVKERKGYKDSNFTLAKQIISDFGNQENPLWTVENIEERTNREAKRITDFIFG
ncbi:HNH endonuclease family protein [Peptoniphilus catoniae]|uniref:HNH endonuclease family protein n=1 Tax=Peptoniphilus catoniae TaxID=1660341 RepID=UPI001C582AAF|nr:HNH endonuclease family protein [Peptoniphilus catoniae]